MRFLILLLLLPLVFSVPITIHVGDSIVGAPPCQFIEGGVAVGSGRCGSGTDSLIILQPVYNKPEYVNRSVNINTKTVVINIKNPNGGGAEVIERLAIKTANCSKVNSISAGGTCKNGAITWSNVQGSVSYVVSGTPLEWEFYEPTLKFNANCGVFFEVSSPRDYAGYMMGTEVIVNGSVKDSNGADVNYQLFVDGISTAQGMGNIYHTFVVKRMGNISITINASSSDCGSKNMTLHVYGLEKKEGAKVPELPFPIAFVMVLILVSSVAKRN